MNTSKTLGSSTTSGKDPGSKTLDNGLRVLQEVAAAGYPCTLTEISKAVGLHATVVHRLLYTLEAHGLVRRDANKRFSPGVGLIPLADKVDVDLRSAARPALERLAAQFEAAAHLLITVNQEEVMAALVVQPPASKGYVAFTQGTRHLLGQGSGGIAMLAGRVCQPGEAITVEDARKAGIAVSHGEILPAVTGVSAPLMLGYGFPEAVIGLSFLSPKEQTVEAASIAIKGAVTEIRNALLAP